MSNKRQSRRNRHESILGTGSRIELFEARRLLASPQADPQNLHLPGMCMCAGCRPMDLPSGFISLSQAMENGSVQPRGGGTRVPLNQLRQRDSRPGAPVTVYLDFDGEAAFFWHAGPPIIASGPLGPNDPIPAFSLDANLNDYTGPELDAMDAIWAHTAEKFSPFDINVTTVRPATFNDGQGIHMIIGGSQNDWLNRNASGVAPVEGFTRSELSNEGFMFSADYIAAGSTTLTPNIRHFIAETVAHEAGHLFGLEHQSVVSGGTVTVEYSPGDATTVPIMGASNGVNNRGIWFNGQSSRRDGNQNLIPLGLQDDLARLTRPGNAITYRVDDFGFGTGSGGVLAVNGQTGIATAAGVIERVGDLDAFSFVASGPVMNFTVTQFTLPGTIIPPGMLAPNIELIPFSGAAPSVSITTNNTSATLSTINATPGQSYLVRVSPQGNAYGNIGQYTISGNVGTFASMSGNTLLITGYNTNNDIDLRWDTGPDTITVLNNIFGGTAGQVFPRAPITGVVVNCPGIGNDWIDILGQFSALSIPVTVNGGAGNDTLFLTGTTATDYQALTTNRGFINNNTPGVFTSIENARLSGFDSADTFDIFETPVGFNVTVLGNDGNDIINVGPSTFASFRVDGNCTIDGDAGSDTMNIGTNFADSVTGNVTFIGGPHSGGTNDRIVYNDTGPGFHVDYDISGTRVVRDGLFLPQNVDYFTTEEIVVNGGAGTETIVVRNNVSAVVRAFGNDGNDFFTRGDGNIVGANPAEFNGGNGIDRITFDDHLNPNNIPFDCRPGQVIYGGILIQQTTGFESVGILAGSGRNDITFVGALQAYSVDAGPGDDTIVIGTATATVVFNQDSSIAGGAGHDTLYFNDVLTNATLSLDGGAGSNTLNVSHPAASGYDIHANQILVGNPFAGIIARFGIVNMTTTNMFGSAGPEFFNVFSVNNVLGSFGIFAGGGNDRFELIPVNSGQFSFAQLTLAGGEGADSLTYNGNDTSHDAAYTFGGSALDVYRGGILTDRVTLNSVENNTLQGGSGNDTITLVQYSNASVLRVQGGLGDDVLNFGQNGTQPISNIGGFHFDGQNGTDTFNFNNQTHSAGGWTYTRELGSITASSPVGFGFFLTDSNTEIMRINDTPTYGVFNVNAVATGAQFIANADDGVDYLQLGLGTNSVQAIQGTIFFNGQASGGCITVSDSADTTGDVVHVDATSIGAYVGDTLFGPGGSVRFSGIVDTDAFIPQPGLVISLGSGADTVYAQPLATVRVTINAGNPAAAPGDTLNLATAVLTSPSINGTPASGNVTASNRQTLNWTGFEGSIATDSVAPVVASADLNLNGLPGGGRAAGSRQAIEVRFSENVSGLLSPASLQLTNLTTGQPIPTANVAVQYVAATNTAQFTFPGYPDGALPDGNYQGKILAGLPDSFGNALPTDVPFSFFFLRGDANHDRKVDVGDLGILASNWQLSGRTFAQGDFNYDGSVDVADLGILASNWQQILPAQTAFSAPAPGGQSLASSLGSGSLPGNGFGRQRIAHSRELLEALEKLET